MHPRGHDGTVGVLSYLNHTNAGTYADAIRLAERTATTPDVTAMRRAGALKYGFGVSADQEMVKDIGVFGRLGWNDGKTESFAFTAIDRLATVGVSVSGARWKRPHDTAATELTMSGISAVHAQYLAPGGSDFLIGDGKLLRVRARGGMGWLFATMNAQHVTNPAYNRDRGPV